MKLTDTLDQILRRLVTDESSAEERRPMPALNHAPSPTIAAELEARAVVRATAPPEAGNAAPVPNAELAHLETAAGVAEKLGLGFHLGSAVERIAIAAGEGSRAQPKLHEATWLIDRYLDLLERRPVGADLQATISKLAREGDAIAGLQAIATALGEPPPEPSSEPVRFSTAPPAPELEPAVEPSRVVEPSAPVVIQHPTFRREIALAGVRAVILVVAVVALVLALTVIAPLWK